MDIRVFWRDVPFWFALLAGPVCWLILLTLGLTRRSGSVDILLLLQLVVLMPVLEEIVFRGGLQSMLLDKSVFAKSLLGISLANLLASAVFAAMHLFNQPPLWAALVFVPSLVFGWARDRFDSIISSIILHCVYNAGFVLLFVNLSG